MTNFQDDVLTKHEEKLKKFKNVFNLVGDDNHSSSEVMAMIDALQRLCLDYHFKSQIEEYLEKQYRETTLLYFRGNQDYHHQNLNDIALSFRLFRQQGHYVPEGGWIYRYVCMTQLNLSVIFTEFVTKLYYHH